MTTKEPKKYNHKGGRVTLPIEERKVQIFAMVKFKYLQQANKEVQELVKKYR